MYTHTTVHTDSFDFLESSDNSHKKNSSELQLLASFIVYDLWLLETAGYNIY